MPGALPERFGPYRVERALGAGGMGAVYVAVDEETGARVAVKTIPPGLELEERFVREAELLAQLRHPHVVRIHAADLRASPPYLVQDLLPGPALSERLRTGPLPVDEAVGLIVDLARAVQHAHDHGVLHRDIKADNVVFDGEGRPVLIDFGLARRTGVDRQSLTATGEVVGTPNAMAPEQAEGQKELTPAVDVYGLGALLYELLTGRPAIPPRGSILATLQAVVDEAPTPPRALRPDLPPAVERVCLAALAKDPAARPASAAAFADALVSVPSAGRGGAWWRVLGLLAAGLLVCAGVVALADRARQPTVDRAAHARLGAQLDALLRDEGAPLRGRAVEAALRECRETARPEDDALRTLSGLRLLAEGELAQPRALAAALEEPDRPPGCALRGAAAVAGGGDGAADLAAAAAAGVRRFDVLAWQVRARCRWGLSAKAAAGVERDLEQVVKHHAALSDGALDRAWVRVAQGKLSEARRVVARRGPAGVPEDLRLSLVLGYANRGRLDEALALAEPLREASDPRRTQAARAILAPLAGAFDPLTAAARVRLARRLNPRAELPPGAARQAVLRITQVRPLDRETVPALVSLALALPDSVRINEAVFLVGVRLRQPGNRGREHLRKLIVPVAERFMELTEGTERYPTVAANVCAYLNDSKVPERAVARAREALPRIPESEQAQLLERLSDGLRLLHQGLAASRVLKRLEELLPADSPQAISVGKERGLVLEQNGKIDEALPLLVRFLERAKLAPRDLNRLLIPGSRVFAKALTDGDLALAERTVARVRKDWPDLPDWRLRAAWCAQARGRAEEAWAHAQAAQAAFRAGHTGPLGAVVKAARQLRADDLRGLRPLVARLDGVSNLLQERYADR